MNVNALSDADLSCEKGEGSGALYTASRDGRVLGYVAIDTTVAGRACGGLRMLPDVSADEVRGLARAMTLKYGFLGLPQGGAKAGIIGDPEASQSERWALLADFGSAIAPLLASRAYIPGSDMGTDCAAIRHMLESVGVAVRKRDLTGNSSGYYTAVSTMAGVLACARHAGLDLSRSTAAVEGFGKVGAPLARLLAQHGATVVAVSTSKGALYNANGLNIDRLTDLCAEVGSRMVEVYREAQFVDRGAVVELPVDVLSQCARHASIHEGNVSRVSARIICPGANNPVTPDAERVLVQRGAVCLPDFVANSGGVLGGTMEFSSIPREEIVAFIMQRVLPAAASILEESSRTGLSARETAERIARERFAEAKYAAEHLTLAGRAQQAGLELYRRGLLPAALVAPAAMRYFDRLFQRWDGRVGRR